MNNFSIRRLALYAKAELCSNRKMLLILMSSAVAYFMIIFYINHLSMPQIFVDGEIKSRYSIATALGFCWGAIMIFSVVYISTAFKPYLKKDSASTYLMLPVSQSEKFGFALVFHSVVVPVLLTILGFLVCAGWALANDVSNDFFSFSFGSLMPFISAIVSILSTLSLFFLGAIFFRRNHFFLTLLSLACASMVFSYIIYVVSLLGFDFEWLSVWLSDMFTNDEAESAIRFFFVGSVSFNTLVAIVCWCLSWSLFRKLQITK